MKLHKDIITVAIAADLNYSRCYLQIHKLTDMVAFILKPFSHILSIYLCRNTPKNITCFHCTWQCKESVTDNLGVVLGVARWATYPLP